jgi:Zn-dependent protease with chaperone function
LADALTSRTLVALGLFAGFYLVGGGVVLALGWLPWAQVRYSGSVGPSGLVAAVGVAYVLWAMIPPRTRWAAPGPELAAGSQPSLHAIVDDVARKARHPIPRAVYLVRDPTAFAGSRPRWFGLRREPIVGIGLPVLVLITDRELAAVIAHEFGHHVGGDVRLGPWQYRTSHAIGAALHRLEESNLFLHLPFYAYGRLFLNITRPASREQELRADALAARLVGASELAGALLALERYGPAWHEYWHGVFVPAVDAGFLPPIVEGYQRLLAGTRPSMGAAAMPDIDDTHPPLGTRLTALGVRMGAREYGPCCLHLLNDLPGIERCLLAPLLTDATVLARLTPVSWDEWGTRMLPAIWHGRMGARREALAKVGLSSLPSLLEDDRTWWERLREGVNVYSPEARRRQLRIWLAHWVALSLLDDGFVVVSAPGAEPTLERASVRLEPFRWVEDLACGARTARDWEALLDEIAPRRA